ncbi:MAG TPA: hypothetical protein VFZ34_13170 [Blastocatellia bacterium]|nr:hypothetical protein [Blastocatellia bacterium]
MKIVKLFAPLTGEHILRISPPLRRTVETGWQRRLNLYTGRSLSDRALALEQQGRAGKLATYGQRLSAGVIAGLDIGLETTATDSFLHIAPGLGVTATGEDVVVPAELRVNVFDIPVLGPSSAEPRGDAPPPHVMLPERLDKLLGQNVAPVGILVLQPIEVEVIGDFDAADQCELDPASYAYEDWLLVDGVRLLYYAWPTELLALPVQDAHWRNRLAYAVFEEEQKLEADDGMPWERVGVPIGLLAFEAALHSETEEKIWRPAFVDRSSVARAGGKPKRRKQVVNAVGNPFLWQARLQQFAEHLTSMAQPNQMRLQMEKLPPAGLLPREALTINFADATNDPVLSSSYFPTAFQLQVLPAPLEQLDVIMEASAPLAPLRLNEAEVVQLLVPVPQVLYDPHLLKREKEAPQFAEEIAQLTTKQNATLVRQKDVENKAKLLGRAIRGEKNPTPLEFQPDSKEEDFGTTLNADGKTRSVKALDALKTTLLGRGKFLETEFSTLEKEGVEGLIRQLEEKANHADDRIDFGFLNVHTDLYRLRQNVLGTALASRLAVFPSVAQIAEDESTVARFDKISQYAQKLKSEQRPGLIIEEEVSEPTTAAEPPTMFLGEFTNVAKFTPPSFSREVSFKDITLKDTGIKVGTDIQLEAATKKVQEESAGTTILPQKLERNVASVTWQAVLPNAYQDPHRTSSVGERIKLPEAPAMQEAAYTEMTTVLDTLGELKINVDEIALPGVLVKVGNDENHPVNNYKEYRANKDSAKLKEPTKLEDEAGYFASAVRLLDNSIGIWRGVERQVQIYRLAIQDCKNTLAELLVLETRINQRLAVIAAELAEVRHDLAVAAALLEEERARVAAINQYRQDIVNNYVDFIAYHRPRTADLLLTAPTRALEPGLSEAPVLACLDRHLTPPDDLRTMIDLLREVPLQWTPRFRPLFAELNQFDVLRKAVQSAQLRAQVQLQTANAITTQQVSAGSYQQSLAKVVTAQQTVSQQKRQQVANLSTALLPQTNWQAMHTLALQHLSIGDLIDGNHGHSKVSHLAAQVLDEIANVAACLHEAFSQVLPEIRLDWAERISQFDAPVNLRNLSSLPRWGEKRNGEDLIPFVERRAMQMHVDWLYQQIDPLEDEATALMHEIIRVCILLASHAPVNQIVQGHVRQPTTVSHGSKVELTVDTAKIKVGMHVLMQAADNVLVRAVVDDLSFEKAAATVVQIHATTQAQATVKLDEKTTVQFAHTQSFDKMAVKMYGNTVRL